MFPDVYPRARLGETSCLRFTQQNRTEEKNKSSVSLVLTLVELFNSHVSKALCGKRLFKLSFSYVCPEPVWGNRSSRCELGAKQVVLTHLGKRRLQLWEVQLPEGARAPNMVLKQPGLRLMCTERRAANRVHACRRNETSSCFSTFPMFVPSLPWQTFGVECKHGIKTTFPGTREVGGERSPAVDRVDVLFVHAMPALVQRPCRQSTQHLCSFLLSRMKAR